MGGALLATVALAAVVGPLPVGGNGTVTFSPIAFFSGRTVGEGVFRRIGARHRAVHVEGNGSIVGTDTIALEQRVEVAGKPARDRCWTLHALGEGRYSGILSEATGPVSGEVRGAVFSIRFRAKGGFRVQQTMHLLPDGKTVQNRLVVRKFGIRVAVLDETIHKLS